MYGKWSCALGLILHVLIAQPSPRIVQYNVHMQVCGLYMTLFATLALRNVSYYS